MLILKKNSFKSFRENAVEKFQTRPFIQKTFYNHRKKGEMKLLHHKLFVNENYKYIAKRGIAGDSDPDCIILSSSSIKL